MANMNTRYKFILSVLLAWTQIIAPAQAQDAFYVYRNDGDFNGFFYSEVVRMGYSKFDLDNIEHDVYVMQEIETTDSLYRIPLAAIDSIGFQQPEIILNDRYHNIGTSSDDPYSKSKTYWSENLYDWLDPASLYPMTEDTKVFSWSPYDASTQEYNPDKHLPKVGDVLGDLWEFRDGSMRVRNLGKVAEVKPIESPYLDYKTFYVFCEPVESFDDVFEQLITVEQLGWDKEGKISRRMAGQDKVMRRVSGTKDLTLASINGSFPIPLYGGPNFDVGLSIDLSLEIKARAVYNICRSDFNISIEFTESGEVSASLTAKGTLEDALTWHLGGAPFYFPAFLPILQVNPAPGAFLKTSGDMSLKLTSPKFAFDCTQCITIDSRGIRAYRKNNSEEADDDNSWGMELSLNGSVQAGTHFPFNIETNTWAKKIFWCSTGIDVYVGPKLSATFALDPAALAKGDNIYGMLGSTKITLSKLCAAYEGTAKFSVGTKHEEEFKIFEGEANFLQMDLNLFPKFDPTAIEKRDKNYSKNGGWNWGYGERNAMYGQCADVIVKPRDLSAPYYIGTAVYHHHGLDKKLILKAYYEKQMYSFFNSYKETPVITLPLYQGKFSIVPLINVLGFDVPAWSYAKEVESTLELEAKMISEDGRTLYGGVLSGYTQAEGWLEVYGVMPDDDVTIKVEIPSDEESGLVFGDGYQEDIKDSYLKVQRFAFSYNRTKFRDSGEFLTITATGKDGTVREKKLHLYF